jgi:cytosine/adenosine deaminase-related metal-dependent hydrolase
VKISRRGLLAGGAAGAVVAATEGSAAFAAGSAAAPLVKRDLLLKRATVVSMDPQFGVQSNCDIHVRNGAIAAIGPGLHAAAAAVIDASHMIAMPGLIDAHNHLWNTMERSVIRESITGNGYFPVTLALGKQYQPSDTYHSALLGAAELLSGGVTTVHSWSHNLISPEYANADMRALRDAGIRARFSYGSYQGGPPPDVPIDLRHIEQLAGDWPAHSNGGLITLGVASRSVAFSTRGPMTIDTLKIEWAAARKLGLPLTIHAQIPGMMENLDKLGLLASDVQLVHPCNWTPADVDAVAKTKATACSAPTTDTRMYFGPIPLQDITKRDITLAMSLDTAGVTGSLDMFTEIRALYASQNASYKAEDGMTPLQLLQIATINGAKALGIADRTGSLTVGKRADIILLRASDLNMAPVSDPVEAIVRCGRPYNVDTVIVDGAILRRNGAFTRLDQMQIVQNAVTAFNAVKARAGVS